MWSVSTEIALFHFLNNEGTAFNGKNRNDKENDDYKREAAEGTF